MKNILLKNTVVSILIIFTSFLLGCENNSNGVKKSDKGTITNSEQTIPLANSNNDKISLNDIKAKTMEDINMLCDKLSRAEDSNSINNILKEYYELNWDKTSFVYFANESGEFYLNPSQVLPKDYDARKRPWYIESIKNANFISEQFRDIGNGNNIITFAKAVSRNNINIGVVGIDRIVK